MQKLKKQVMVTIAVETIPGFDCTESPKRIEAYLSRCLTDK